MIQHPRSNAVARLRPSPLFTCSQADNVILAKSLNSSDNSSGLGSRLRNVQPATFNQQRSTCDIQPATFNLQRSPLNSRRASSGRPPVTPAFRIQTRILEENPPTSTGTLPRDFCTVPLHPASPRLWCAAPPASGFYRPSAADAARPDARGHVSPNLSVHV